MSLLSNLALPLVGFTTLLGFWLAWQLLCQNGRIQMRLDELENRLNEMEFGGDDEPDGLPLGSDAPAFELPDLAGGSKSLAQFHGQPILLVFFNPECGFCRELMPKLASYLPEGRAPRVPDSRRPQQHHGLVELGPPSQGRPLVLILTTGDAGKNRQFFAEHKVGCLVLLQNDREIAKTYQVNGTPAGYLVSADGKVASELAIGAEALLALASAKPTPPSSINSQPGEQSLLTTAATNGEASVSRFVNRSLARSKIKRDGLKAGSLASDFRLPRLDRRGELALEDLRGRRVLLVFSDPHCGPCNTLAPELEEFHREHSEQEIVMITKGEPKENRAKVREHGLTFPVLLQQQWEISRRYAMFATPIAYRIDEAGVIANDVAVGTDAIQALLSEAGAPAPATDHRADRN